ncbi:leukocyte-associated immunoglobulin-like receptor 2 [Phyllostomus hastatus]|uniref:leukocyte-associated immunoglobulin-like receptor 2 n=1 Tax=Phyllostomus hastatus TaxID=9423 RepID=UPI001E6852D1|nr:leukocyte-associated immunoglobulin-like receptor 2 [Phyllostomus hastatus]
MDPHLSSLLVLVLCLGQTIHMQNRALPKPSITAELDPVICRGRPATIVCRGPAWADTFRLVEKENISAYRDEKLPSQHGSQGAEARFLIEAVSEVTARSYFCFYSKGISWSEFSEPLELRMAGEDGSTPPSAPASLNYTVGNSVCIGLSCVVLLILVVILAEAGHSWHRWPHQPHDWRQESRHQRN